MLCHVRGGSQILNTISRQLGLGPDETTADLNYSLDRVACVGSCALAFPMEAITGEKKKPQVFNQQFCIRSGSCRQVCKFEAVLVE